jgi:hypothetical protein
MAKKRKDRKWVRCSCGRLHPPDEPVDLFVAEECDLAAGCEHEEYRIEASDLYRAYADWCRRAELEPVTQTAFGRRLNVLGAPVQKRGGRCYRVGVRLRPCVAPCLPKVAA